jgi:ParB family chromosome partitioning protein
VALWSASRETGVDLEFHQLDCRYESLRVRQPERERRLLASLADHGQQMPIVVVHGACAYVVVDGHKRLRCLKRLHRDSVAGVVWEMSEPDALIFRQMVHSEGGASALEQGWLLRALHEGHEVRLPDLARRFDRSVAGSRGVWPWSASCPRPSRIESGKAGSCLTRP